MRDHLHLQINIGRIEHVLYDTSVGRRGRRWLREHEAGGVLEDPLAHEVRRSRLQVLLGAVLALDVAVQVRARQSQRD